MADSKSSNTENQNPKEGKSYTVLYPVEGLETTKVYPEKALKEQGYHIAFLLRTGHLEVKA